MEQILEVCKGFGNPFYFQHHHGLTIRIDIDSVIAGKYGSVEFHQARRRVLNLSSGNVRLKQVLHPDNLIMDLRVCLEIRQERTGEVLGWLCWPIVAPKSGESHYQAREKEGKLKATHIEHCQVCGNRFEPGQTVCFVPLDNNITCQFCAVESDSYYEQRAYKPVS